MTFIIIILIIIFLILRKYQVFKLIYYIYKDLFEHIENKKNGISHIHLYGIYGFFGLPGYGKTMAMTHELNQLREKHGDNIYIFTNYGYSKEDKSFSHWKMLFEDYDKPAIFAWDEVQNEFNSRDYKNFPVSLLTMLTQNRKGHGKRVYYTAQRYTRVDKVFRELTISCAECKTHFGRLTILKWFDWEDYEMFHSQTNIHLKMKVKPFKKDVFVQTDEIRNDYNSFQMLDTAKNKKYLDRDEINRLTT